MSRSSSPARLDPARLEPGSRTRLELPVARLTTGNWVALPVEAVRGARDGPALLLSAALHGDELDGVEIIRRVLRGLDPGRMAGIVYALPVVNVFGFIGESRYLPDRRDLNRSFPGSARGSLAARLAHLVMSEIVVRCQWGIDFHSGSDDRENLPQVRADLDEPETLRLARAFGPPVLVHNTPADGSLRRAASAVGARVIVYEGGEAGRFSAKAIAAGVAGVHDVLLELGMVEGRGERAAGPPGPAPQPERCPTTTRRTHWVRAGRSGICRIDVELGARVRRNDRLGVISDALGIEEQPVRARWSGLVIGRRVNPVVYQGEALVHIAEPERPT